MCCILGASQGITNQQPPHAPCMSTLKLHHACLHIGLVDAARNPHRMTNGSCFPESALFAAWLQMCCVLERRSTGTQHKTEVPLAFQDMHLYARGVVDVESSELLLICEVVIPFESYLNIHEWLGKAKQALDRCTRPPPSCHSPARCPINRPRPNSYHTLPCILPILLATLHSVLGVGTFSRVPSPGEVLIASIQLDPVERTSRARAPLRPQRQRERILIGIFLFTARLLACISRR